MQISLIFLHVFDGLSLQGSDPEAVCIGLWFESLSLPQGWSLVQIYPRLKSLTIPVEKQTGFDKWACKSSFPCSWAPLVLSHMMLDRIFPGLIMLQLNFAKWRSKGNANTISHYLF